MSGRETGYFIADAIGVLKSSTHSTSTWNAPGIDDPKLDAMLDEASAATDRTEQARLGNEINMYVIANHWFLWSHRVPQMFVYQPWIVGHSDETLLGVMERGPVQFARLWIDQELKDQYVN